MATKTDITLTASELRVVLGQLIRRLRAEHRFPLVAGRRARPTRARGPAQHRRPGHGRAGAPAVDGPDASPSSRRAGWHAAAPTRADGRRVLVEPTEEGLTALEEDRRNRVGWLV